ncbi:MAG TPA: TonB-dependent receptor [Longimicrobiales bacterium]|nr:TonB-dependent receptor [Longimicrobiales bacterium]
MTRETTSRCSFERVLLLALALGVLPSTVAAQAPSGSTGPVDFDTLIFRVDPLVVTATRGPREASRIPQPVSVVQRRDLIQQVPNTVTDLFRNLPGLDVTGVGVNQGRPQIRGQRGQRILLLEDGIRLNNFRRQQDFGELPALVDVTGVERVEVVRGPASVLYGSDAIGGVVNIITRTPEQEGFHGLVSGRYGSAESQKTGSARVFGRSGGFTVRAGGTLRRADAYEAPAGTFGDIELTAPVLVQNTGVEDRSMDLRLGWEPAGHHSVYGKFETYTADNAGFGSVDPNLYAPGSPDIQITYPSQTWSKFTAGYLGRELGTPLADQVTVTAYGQDNERNLQLGFELGLGPTATMNILNQNFTNVRTYGARVEARKLADPRLLLTYGVDLVKERAEGTDHNSTVITGFGPDPITDVSDRPQLPTASFLALGAFAQGEVTVTDRLSFVAGGRYQSAKAQTYATPGLEDLSPTSITDGTFVAALNSIFDLGGGVSLVGSAGRAFRSPNLIERFFDGATPEGSGYQIANPDLKAETSFNTDLGLRYRSRRLSLEGFYFRNKIFDGIRIQDLGTEVNGIEAYQNTNVEELIFRGVELDGEVYFADGFTVGGNYTWMDSKDALKKENPVGESFNSKVTGTLRYDDPANRFWGSWEIRHNGDRKDVDLGTNPIGDVLPAFTIQNLRVGATLFRTESGVSNRLVVAVTNLTDQLYAEFSNASFFRPEPRRSVTLSWEVVF